MNIFHFALCILLGVIAYLVCFQLYPTPANLAFAQGIQLGVFIFGFLSLARVHKTFFSLYGIFLLVFFIFQNGQMILYAFGIGFDDIFVRKYGLDTLLEATTFSTSCLMAALAAGIFSKEKKHAALFFRKINNLSPSLVVQIGKIAWFALVILAMPLICFKLFITATRGYHAMMLFMGEYQFITLIEKLFMSFTILLLVYVPPHTFWHKILMFFGFAWSAMAALTGDRTAGLAGLTIIALVWSCKSQHSQRWSIRRYLLLGFVALALIYLIPFIFNFREQAGAFGNYRSGNVVISTISELGFSTMPLILMMSICPSLTPFLWGKSFLGSLVAGFIPRSADILGLTKWFAYWASYPSYLMENFYNFNFGVDFSLNAECYINFGWWGWIAMFALCSIIATCLKQVNFKRSDNLFSQYSALILLYSWFTLPRRKAFYIFNNFFWYVLVVGTVLFLIISFIKRKKREIKL